MEIRTYSTSKTTMQEITWEINAYIDLNGVGVT
jgi:hypothetical protein